MSSGNSQTYHIFPNHVCISKMVTLTGTPYQIRISSEGLEIPKLTGHLSHILQLANWLLTCHSTFLIISIALQWGHHWCTTSETGHRQDLLCSGVRVGGHTWKMTHSQEMEFFGAQKYFCHRASWGSAV